MMASTTESVEQKKLMLRISDAVYGELRKHGEETYPHECCGVLLGHALDGINEVNAAVRAGNTRSDSAHNRYHIAPQELISIQRQARERSMDIVGFYHSHPDHPARWSSTDFTEAHWVGCSYVLTSGHTELKNHLYSEEGKLLSFVNVYLNDEDIRYLSEKENTAVKESDSLSIIPSIAGGSEMATLTEVPVTGMP